MPGKRLPAALGWGAGRQGRPTGREGGEKRGGGEAGARLTGVPPAELVVRLTLGVADEIRRWHSLSPPFANTEKKIPGGTLTRIYT